MIKTAVIPVAGLGTRMLPFTKEQPKEMLPLFVKAGIKPTVQIIFEQLYAANIRKFIFIVGRGKRVIEDHFTPDYAFLRSIRSNGMRKELSKFYKKIEASSVVWINQSHPKGFGHAVLLASPYVENDLFLVHAGDTIIMAPHRINTIKEMTEKCDSDRHKHISCICIRKIADKKLLKRHGVVNINANFQVTRAVEKPSNPKSDFAIMPIYILTKKIFDILKKLPAGKGNEIQLTDAINYLIQSKQPVVAYVLTEEVLRIDVGSPETYYEALLSSKEAQ